MSITISQNARGDPVRDLAPSPVEPAHIYLTPSHTDDGMTTPYRYLGRESGVRDSFCVCERSVTTDMLSCARILEVTYPRLIDPWQVSHTSVIRIT